MAGLAHTGGGLAGTFQSRLFEKLKDRGLIPMSSGVTRPLPPVEDYSLTFKSAGEEIARARGTHGARTDDRYSASVGQSYRDRRFEFLKGLEGVSLKAYPDAGGTSVALGFHMDKNGAREVWDRAFGKTVSFDDVKAGKAQLTMAQAKTLFEHDAVAYERMVDTAMKGKALTQNQRLAMFSVAYNAPKRFLDNAAVWRSGDEAAITEAILTKTFAPKNGELLKTRRHAEASMFVSPVEARGLIPSWDDYAKAVKVDAKGNAVINGETNAALAVVNKLLPANITRRAVAIPEPKPGVYVDQVQGRDAQTRREEISPKLYNLLNSVGAETGVHFEVYSGGQSEKTGFTGSTRHDHGHAADVRAYVMEGGKKRYLDQSNPNDRPVWSQIVKLSRAGGATGIGAAEGYMGNDAMHIGFNGKDRVVNGKVVRAASNYTGVWGAGGDSATAPKWLRDAWDAGAHVPPLNIPDVASKVDTAASTSSGSADVRSIQQTLSDRGFSPGAIDGIEGPKTKEAVKAFQRSAGLVDDGIVGPKTLAALERAGLPPTPMQAPPRVSVVPSARETADKVRTMLTPSARETGVKVTAFFDARKGDGKPVTVYVSPDGTERRAARAGDAVLPPDMTYDWETGKLVKKNGTEPPPFVAAGAAKMASGSVPLPRPRPQPLGLMSQAASPSATQRIGAPAPAARTPAKTVAQRQTSTTPAPAYNTNPNLGGRGDKWDNVLDQFGMVK